MTDVTITAVIATLGMTPAETIAHYEAQVAAEVVTPEPVSLSDALSDPACVVTLATDEDALTAYLEAFGNHPVKRRGICYSKE